MPAIKLDELENAAILVEDGAGSAHALVARDSGMIHLLNDEYMDEEAPLPGDIEAGGNYVPVPAASELGLGRELMRRFGIGHLQGDQQRLQDIFARQDPYDRFSRLLEERGLLDAWYGFRERETRAALEAWCRQHGLMFQ
ncbi:hypothetical protein [Massilia aerilata]|uniref:Uncharacterized protein n=1 Tax=Massilia aerilata TaxID=453817 RepID=A0ABW0RUR9_9BURK